MLPILQIQLLGGFSLHSAATPATSLDHPRLQALLAYLVLHRAAPHTRQHLAFLLWPDSSEAQARTNLRALLHRLRQALPEADQLLQIDGQTVQWRADAHATLDVAAFERALDQAQQAEQRGDSGLLRAAFAAAVELYRGELLPGWYDDWVLLERERLRQAFLVALERLALLLEREGDYPAAIGSAQRLLRHDPLHEVTYQHLMRLHRLSGDRASALRVYQTCATVLERELGVEPSSATRAAYEQLLHTTTPARPPVERPAADLSTARHNLPVALTSFIGRASEIAEIGRLLVTTRLLTLTGAGGSGKTRLALAAASEAVAANPAGVWLVELATLTDQALVPQAVAATVGVREQPQQPLSTTLVEAIQSRHMLLVLDNCEHLIDACAHLAQQLLRACPQLRILATSREALGLVGETAWPVPALALPDPDDLPAPEDLARVEAIQLFLERAAAALPTFRLTPENTATVAQICRRLDGIPLAIELAAARVKVLGVAQLAARLDNCFQLLTVGNRAALPRQQSLQAVIDWSYTLLSEPERAVFQRLAVFAGGWILEAAEAICADVGSGAEAEPIQHPTSNIQNIEVLHLLARLVDKSLVVVEESGGTTRYRLLETIRQYARSHLQAAGEEGPLRMRHRDWFLSLVESISPQLWRPQQVVWLAQLEAEHDNLRAALEWSLKQQDVEPGLRLAGALWPFWRVRGYPSEGRAWLEQALGRVRTQLAVHAPEQANASQIRRHMANALYGAGVLARNQCDYSRANMLVEESLALRRALGDTGGMAYALNVMGLVALDQADFEQARAYFEQSLALSQGQANRFILPLYNLGMVAAHQGNTDRARALYEECLALGRRQGDRRIIAYALASLGGQALEQGDHKQARLLYEESLALKREQGDRETMAWSLEGLASVAAAQGQPIRAAQVFGAAEALREAIGMPVPPVNRANYERYVAVARTQLDQAAFAAAWAAGRARPLEHAVVEALHASD